MRYAQEIGSYYGHFFLDAETDELCINNGEQTFRYDSAEELLIDWEGTLIRDSFDNDIDWDEVLEYIDKLNGKQPQPT